MVSVTKMPSKPSDKELEEIKDFLELVLVDGADVVSEWELNFVASIQSRIDKIRLSDKQKEGLWKVKQKMIKEELCSEDDYAAI